MNNKPIKLFSASAGAGKTYTLTLEYLKLALKEVETKGYFRRILAVTFTNKAAEEMKRRIVDFLYLIAKNEYLFTANPQQYQESNQLIERILSDFKNDKIKINKTELIQRANKTLQLILQDYGLFAVMTIDSFIQKLSQSFIEELNLPDQFEVNLDTKSLLNDLIDDILDKLNVYPDLVFKKAILDFSLAEVEEDKSWNALRDSLQKFLLILFDEEYLEKEKLINQFEIDDFIIIENQIIAFEKDSMEFLVNKAKSLIHLVELNGLEIGDFYQGGRGPIADFYKYIQSPQLAGNNYSYMESAIQTGKWEAGKIAEFKKKKIQEIAIDLQSIAEDFFVRYQKASRKVGFLLLIKQHLRKFSLLKFIQNELRTFQNENGIISISEFSKKINQIVSNDPIPFIYEKLGDRFQHILIDEFQDTSILQWKNFMPLIENSTAYSHTNLIVGDAKQSIYKFRGGEVGLIASLFSNDTSFVNQKIASDSLDFQRFEEIITNIHPENLGDNYRSSKEIVHFNNSFYEWIHSNTTLASQFPLINQVYGKYVIQEPKHSMPIKSSIQCSFYKVSDQKNCKVEEERNWNLQHVKSIIDHSINEKKYRFKDIAILTRGNKEANFLALELKKMGIPLTSSDSLLLNFAPSIRFILSFLQNIIKPNSSIHRFELISNLQILNNQLDTSLLNWREVDYSFDIESSIYLLKDIVNEIINKFQLLSYTNEIPYILKFLDILDEYSLQKSNAIDDFLNYFESNKNVFSINGNTALDAITISTIHKSKGLEYPVVILAFANWQLNPQKGSKWFTIENKEEFVELNANEKFLSDYFLPIQSKTYEGFDFLEKQLLEENQLSTLEAINMLYVATTRPKYDLYILSRYVDPSSTKRNVNEFEQSVAKLIYQFCAHTDLEVKDSENELSYNFHDNSTSVVLNQKNESNAIFCINANKCKEQSIEVRHQRDFQEQFSASVQKRELGNTIHELIAENNLDSIIQKVRNLLNNPSIDNKFIESFLQFILMPENQYLFNLQQSILNEQEIITQEGTIYRPDRISKLNDVFVVIDYKTGKPNEKHKEQISTYKTLLEELNMVPVEGKIVYFEEGRVEHV